MTYRLRSLVSVVTLIGVWIAICVVHDPSRSRLLRSFFYFGITALLCIQAMFRRKDQRAFWSGAVLIWWLMAIPLEFPLKVTPLTSELAQHIVGRGDYFALVDSVDLSLRLVSCGAGGYLAACLAPTRQHEGFRRCNRSRDFRIVSTT